MTGPWRAVSVASDAATLGAFPDHFVNASEGDGEAVMNRIRAARQALGWTQNDLAEHSGVSPRTIHAIEKGATCRQATKRRILAALGVPWEQRSEYFPIARTVRRVTPLDEAQRA